MHHREEILAAARSSGAGEVGEIAAVVLETDRSISIIPSAGPGGDASALANLERKATPPRPRRDLDECPPV